MGRHLDRRSARGGGVVVEAVEGRLLFETTPPPVVPPPQAPPVPTPGLVLNKGVLAIGGDPKVSNTITVSLSSDHKQINVTVNGKKHAPFAASAVTDVIVAGGPKNDTIGVALGALTTLKHPAVIFGLDGNDKIAAGGERDLIFAGAGNDVVVAGPGKDVVHGGDGNDSLWGDKDDLLDGGAGTNVIHLVPPPPAPTAGGAS